MRPVVPAAAEHGAPGDRPEERQRVQSPAPFTVGQLRRLGWQLFQRLRIILKTVRRGQDIQQPALFRRGVELGGETAEFECQQLRLRLDQFG
ncbi:hypothetical protein SDC9_60466 [bioreactor metagenome]|uniref:Uncharacterized protein n=1 Tax=bioreactor metagenome TaxID=1076179 RepID=A0A644XD02_9ZZZZ